jgi:penicillin-insensitive murein endopeptidase
VSSYGNFRKENDPPPRNIREDRSEAVGFYSDGSLLNGVSLPPESPAHLKIFRPRNRGWGTETLIRTLLGAISEFHREFSAGDRVQIGDLAAEYGGPISSTHISHQNGLDVDIAYLRMNHVERDPNDRGNHGFGEVFVKNKRLTKNFDLKRNWFLLKAFVGQGNVVRIFVDPEIKRAFCGQSKKLDPFGTNSRRTSVLRRLRPYPNHDDHFHVRIRCPANSPKCVAQEEPPTGSGCDQIDLASGADEFID